MKTNQQLKAHCEDVIANQFGHWEDWVVDMARVALASLEAEPVAYISDAKLKTLAQGIHSTTVKPDAVMVRPNALYLSPPVLEMKSSRIKKLAEEIVENLVDCGPADVEAVEQYTAWVIQRLNGVKS
ncbi:hypothetical protein [Pantoea endophytica]